MPKWLLFFIAIGLIATMGFYLKLGFIPILSALSPEERISVQAGNGIFLQFIRFGVYASIVLYFFTNNKKLCFSFFLMLNLAMLGTGFRGEFVQFFFYFCLCYITVNSIKISITKLFLFGFFTLFFIISLEYFRTQEDSDFLFFLFGNLGLSLSVAVFNFEFILTRFDNFQWGQTFLHNFSMFLPGPDIDYTRWLTEQVNMNFKGGITPTIIGDLYVNFSTFLYYGIFVFASLIKTVENKIILNQNSIIKTIFWVNFSLLFARSVTGGFSNQSLQLFITSIFLLFILIIQKIKYESNIST